MGEHIYDIINQAICSENCKAFPLGWMHFHWNINYGVGI